MAEMFALGIHPTIVIDRPTGPTPEPEAKAKREKSTAELRGAVKRMLRAYVARIERDGDVVEFAQLDAMRAMLAETIDDAAGRLLADPWRYSTQQLADELDCSRNNVHKRFGHHIVKGGGPRGLRWLPPVETEGA